MSPLGKYSDVAAALVAVLLVVAAVVAHLGLLVVTEADHAWLDTSAGIAIGVILGQRATTNGAGKLANTANRRLDAIGAPPAHSLPPDPAA